MKKIILRNSSAELLFIGIVAIIGLVKTRLITNMLGIEYYGLFSLFNPLFQILVIVDAGMGSAFLVDMYAPMVKKRYDEIAELGNGLIKTFKSIAGKKIKWGLILALFIPLIIGDTTFSMMYIFLVYMLFLIGNIVGTFFYAPIQIFESNKDNHIASFWNNLFLLIQVFLEVVILVIFTMIVEIDPAIVMILILTVAIFIKKPKQFIIMKRIEAKYDGVDFSAVGSNIKPQEHKNALTMHAIAGATQNVIKPVLVSAMLGLTMTGIYGMYNIFINLATQVFRAISSGTSGPLKSHIASEKEIEHISVYVKINTIMTIAVLMISVGLALFIEPAIRIFLNQDVSIYGLPFIIGLAFLLRTVRMKLHDVEQALKLFEETKTRALIESTLVIVLSPILILKFGIPGVFIAGLIGSLFVCIVDPIIIVKKHYDMKFVLYNYLNYIVAVTSYIIIFTVASGYLL